MACRRAVQMALKDLEALRAELHEYGALAPQAHLDALGARLRDALADPQLEAFLRRTGGLKAELAGLQGLLCAPGVCVCVCVCACVCACV
jgi:hypothetical protein